MQKTFNRRKTYFWCTATQLIVEVQTQYSKELLTCISCYEAYISYIIYLETCRERFLRLSFSQNSTYNETLFLISGEVPAASDGIVSATGCINNGRECCVSELPIQVRNCSSSQGVDSRGDGIVVYHLGPTPECNMGYCAGEGLPCPNGLTSKNGYTPCNCKQSTFIK